MSGLTRIQTSVTFSSIGTSAPRAKITMLPWPFHQNRNTALYGLAPKAKIIQFSEGVKRLEEARAHEEMLSNLVKLNREDMKGLKEVVGWMTRDLHDLTKQAIKALLKGDFAQYARIKETRQSIKNGVSQARKILAESQEGLAVDGRNFSKLFKGVHL